MTFQIASKSSPVPHRDAFWTAILTTAFLTWPLNCSAQDASPRIGQRFPDVRGPIPESYKGEVFRLSQDYPKTRPQPENYPWLKFKPKTEASAYLRAVLEYAVEGNDVSNWTGSENPTRKWYHAPWLHYGRNGREFVHGLTHERVSQPFELSPMQSRATQNWAVGLYNDQGGFTIGEVWHSPKAPDAKKALFASGTVSVKLLFTEAAVADVPYLVNAFEWLGYVYETVNIPTNPNARRAFKRLRLLQIDVAIKDDRLEEKDQGNELSGWVFGTFIYNGEINSPRLWDRFVAVGSMWGNDLGLTVGKARQGISVRESWINTDANVPFQHLGWAGRLNGPVDNPTSSCLSCHSVAQVGADTPLVPRSSMTPDSEDFMNWFRNFRAPTPFTPGAVSLDYSLQLMAGIANFREWESVVKNQGGITTPDMKAMTFDKNLDGGEANVSFPSVSRSGLDE